MSTLLFVTSSLFGAGSKSRLIASEFVDAWRQTHPNTVVVERDLSPAAIPHFSQDALVGAGTPTEQRTPEQRDAVAFADTLIRELESADAVVLAVPMYNFSIPSTLKAWIDHVTRAGRTFRYTEKGPEGLLKGKQVFVITGRGGVYSADGASKAIDFQEPYLRWMLSFVGLTDVTFIHIEGLQMGPEAAASGLDRARKSITQVLAAPAASAA